jgi:MerR family copper efflux transcriptional regulator
MESSRMTISRLGDLTGIPAKTIRYYEEEGLIAPPGRGINGYRQYSTDAVEQLKLIKAARDLDLPIGEIKTLMQGCEHGHCRHPKGYLESRIDAYTDLLDAKIRKLTALRTKFHWLKHELESSRSKPDGYCCDLLRQVASVSKGGD